MSEPIASQALVSWIDTGSWILTPADIATTTSLAPTASAHSACATAAYTIYITATSHALAALHRIVALIADLFNREVTRALSLRCLTTPADALAALLSIAALATYRRWITTPAALINSASTATVKILAFQLRIEALITDLLTRKATDPFYVYRL